MKKADLEKLLANKIAGRMKQEPHSDRYGTASGSVFDKKEQRERDKAAGLVPFAVKLPQEMVTALQSLAQEREMSLNDLAAELLGEKTGVPGKVAKQPEESAAAPKAPQAAQDATPQAALRAPASAGAPSKPTTPAKPTAPAKPATPAKPTAPAKPATPAKPKTPAKPATPAKPKTAAKSKTLATSKKR